MTRIFVMFGAILMAIGVGAGAFGAHGLEAYLTKYELTGTFETAVRYLIYHALALFVTAWLVEKWDVQTLTWAGYAFIAGAVLFSGSLFLLVVTRISWLGAITPLGGVAFIAGWVLIFVAAWRAA